MQQQSFAAFVTFSLFFADAFMFVGFYVVFISLLLSGGCRNSVVKAINYHLGDLT